MISVIITTHNRATLLSDAIESVLAQEPCGEEVELIVVDDDSTDETPAVVSRYNQAKYVRTSQGTPGGARNAGAAAARGQWIAYLDDDDIWLPRKLASCVQAIAQTRECAFLCSAAVICDQELRRYWTVPAPDLSGRRSDYDAFLDVIPLPSTSIFRRDVLLEIGGFDQSLSAGEDRDLALHIASRGYKCISIREPLVLYRVNPWVFQWKTAGERLVRLRYSENMKVLNRYFAAGMPMRPGWLRRQQVLWRTRGWHAFQLLAAARQAKREGENGMAWRLRRVAFSISPLHTLKNLLKV